MIDDLANTSVVHRIASFRSFLRYCEILLQGLGHDVFGEHQPSSEEIHVWYGILLSRSFGRGRHPPTLVGGIDCCTNHNDDPGKCETAVHDADEGTDNDAVIPEQSPDVIAELEVAESTKDG